MNAVSSKISDLEVECASRAKHLFIRQSDSPTDPEPVELIVHETQIPWLIKRLRRAIAKSTGRKRTCPSR